MTHTLTVPEGTLRERADKILATAFPQFSRVAIQRAFDAGRVTRNGQAVAKKGSVSAGDALAFSLPETVASDLTPNAIPLEIIFEDRHMLAVNKHAGMVVHPGAGTGGDTLVHALLAHCRGSLSGIGGVERPGIVHRLDRETSGIMLVAKTDVAHRGLAAQFAGRTVRKEYLALATGAPELLSGIIDKPIGRNPRQRHKMAVAAGETRGRQARTDWEVEEAFGKTATLIRCRIHTGRTHQIRVHLWSLGNSVLGDRAYGFKVDPRLPWPPPRVMLHAEHLVFQHPVTGKTLDLHAPLPADMTKMIAALRKLRRAKKL